MTIELLPGLYPATLGWGRHNGRPAVYLIFWRLTL